LIIGFAGHVHGRIDARRIGATVGKQLMQAIGHREHEKMSATRQQAQLYE
jgi:hypothetical protein